ncbi:hypothetical protein EST38_g9552 [Candolleomyces aberdarensis]|uniref:HNH nuclease domain-containing protein n=1 Tax=Candolleomyces aberdarensis TaxID=2316362 RepID=A0A4Q2DBC1_9AGAR|nr:hypothetical protein EST38_g9552 [Candolleomyces aberdarensis]
MTDSMDSLDDLVLRAKVKLHPLLFPHNPNENGVLLGELLFQLLTNAPTDSGKRFIARRIIDVAEAEGDSGLANLAASFLSDMLFPIVSLSDTIARSGGHDEKSLLKWALPPQTKLYKTLIKREDGKCGLLGYMDRYVLSEMRKEGKAAPAWVLEKGLVVPCVPTHILPICSSNSVNDQDPNDPTKRMRDLLNDWAGMDVAQLVGPTVHAPHNSMFMNMEDRGGFTTFIAWLEATGSENEYVPRSPRGLSTFYYTKPLPPTRFPTKAESGIDPPDPTLLKIHAALSRVIHACKADKVYEKEMEERAKADMEWVEIPSMSTLRLSDSMETIRGN